MAEKLYVKDWSDYQHYKDRRPVWIKLKTDVFSNYNFCRLSDPAKLLLMAVWTLASRNNEGWVYDDFSYVKTECHLGEFIQEIHWQEIVKQGFLFASNPIAECSEKILESISVSNSESGKGGVGEKPKPVSKFKTEYSDEFLEFWEAYPPNRCPKSKAFESYQKSRKVVDHAEIITGARNYAAECAKNGTDIKFIAHASTWLNQKRWEVDYTLQIRSEARTTFGRKSNFDDVMASAARLAAREVSSELDQREDFLFG